MKHKNLKYFLTYLSCSLLISLTSKAQWTEIKKPTEYINSIAANDKIITIGSSEGVYISQDNGATWLLKNNNLSETILNITYSSKFSQDSVYERIDVSSSYINSIVTDEVNFYIGTRHGLYISSDSGTSWLTNKDDLKFNSLILKEVNLELNNENILDTFYTKEVSSVFVNNKKIFILTSGNVTSSFSSQGEFSSASKSIGKNSLFLSSDNGNSWNKINTPPYYINSVSVNENNLIIATEEGLFLSSNNGKSWANAKFSTKACSKNIASVIVVDSKIVIASDCGVFLSNDNGISWTESNNGLRSLNISTLTAKDKTLFVVSDNNLFYSNDFGKNWHISDNEPRIQDDGIKLLAINNSNIYLVTNENKIWYQNRN